MSVDSNAASVNNENNSKKTGDNKTGETVLLREDIVSVGPAGSNANSNQLKPNEDISNFTKTAAVSISPANSFSDLYSPLNNYLHKGNPIVLFTLSVVNNIELFCLYSSTL